MMSDKELAVVQRFFAIDKFTDRQKQFLFHVDAGLRGDEPAKFLLFGGAVGGGKSYLLRHALVRRLVMLYQVFQRPNLVGMLACEDYPTLSDRQLQRIQEEFPPELGKFYAQHATYKSCFKLREELGGGVIVFRNLDDPSKYQSAEYVVVAVDELTKNDLRTFTMLRSRLRWPGIPDEELQFWGATNPGGPGMGWVKQFWLDGDFGDEWRIPVDVTRFFKFVPSKATDNPHLDPSYWATLQTLPERERKAFADGDWDVFSGQAFPEFSQQIHVIEPHAVPEDAPLYMTYDWGSGKPFSIGWWYVDADGRIIRFAEWYGWSGTADTGLRLPDSDVARGIVDREREMGIDPSRLDGNRIAGHDCFSKRPDYQGGGQGKSTAEVFTEHGLYLRSTRPDRMLKIRQFRERLRVPGDGSKPMLLVFNTCRQFIRTIQTLTMDENRIEDIDTKGEDHVYDEAAMLCQDRPNLPPPPPAAPKPLADRRIDMITKQESRGAVINGPDPWQRSLYGVDTGMDGDGMGDPVPTVDALGW